jgi:hydrogenase maturation protease
VMANRQERTDDDQRAVPEQELSPAPSAPAENMLGEWGEGGDGSWPTGTQVLCLGSPHGDDQIGWRVGEALHHDFPHAQAAIHLLRDVWQLVDYLRLGSRVLIIDACQGQDGPGSGRAEEPCGTVTRLTWPDARLQDLRSNSTHGGSLVEALRMAEVVNRLPREVVILAVRARQFAPSAEPAPELLASLPEVVRRIRQELFPGSEEEGGNEEYQADPPGSRGAGVGGTPG